MADDGKGRHRRAQTLFDGVPDKARSGSATAIRSKSCPMVSRCSARPTIAPWRRWCILPSRSTACSSIPEVTHSEYGQRILENFVRRVCRCGSDWKPSSAETIEAIKADIRARVGPTKNVLFFVSGGVDSSVAYKLCADALGQDRVHGVYVDTGFMRKNESADVMSAYEKAGFRNVRLRDASAEFLAAVGTRDESRDQAQANRRRLSRGRERRARASAAGRVAARAGHDLSRHDRVGRHARVGAHQDPPQPCARAAAADRGGRDRRAARPVL